MADAYGARLPTEVDGDQAALAEPSPLAPWLPPGWRVLGRCRFGTAMPGPLASGCHAVAHPAVGVALLDQVPDATPNAEARLRRALGAAEFWPDFPGTLPVWHGRIDTADLRGLEALLHDQFAVLPPLTVAGGPAWVTAVGQALAADPAWEAAGRQPRFGSVPAPTSLAAPASLPDMADAPPPRGRVRSRASGARRGVVLAVGGLVTFVVGVLVGLALLPAAPVTTVAEPRPAPVRQAAQTPAEPAVASARPMPARPMPEAPASAASLRAAAITSPATTPEDGSQATAPPLIAPQPAAPQPGVAAATRPQVGAPPAEALPARALAPAEPTMTSAPSAEPTRTPTSSAEAPWSASGVLPGPALAPSPLTGNGADRVAAVGGGTRTESGTGPAAAAATVADAILPLPETAEAALPQPPPIAPEAPGIAPAAAGNRPARQASARGVIDRACSSAVFRYQQGERLSATDAAHVRNGCATRRS